MSNSKDKNKTKIDVMKELNQIIKNISKKNYRKRLVVVIIGIFFSALSFNLFFLPNDLVVGGVSGLSIVINKITGMDTVLFISISSIVLIGLSLFFLGIEVTMTSIVSIIMFPIFVGLTSGVINYINIEDADMILIVIFGGLLSGIAGGLILKKGFNTGGTNIIILIVSKYFKMSMGKAMLIVDGIIIASGVMIFGWTRALYGVLCIYIASFITDRVILGISNNKAFYIVTENPDIITEFIIKKLDHSVTLIDVKGGYTNNVKKMLLCVIPSKEYFVVTEMLKQIDKNAFFVVTDSYTVSDNSNDINLSVI